MANIDVTFTYIQSSATQLCSGGGFLCSWWMAVETEGRHIISRRKQIRDKQKKGPDNIYELFMNASTDSGQAQDSRGYSGISKQLGCIQQICQPSSTTTGNLCVAQSSATEVKTEFIALLRWNALYLPTYPTIYIYSSATTHDVITYIVHLYPRPLFAPDLVGILSRILIEFEGDY